MERFGRAFWASCAPKTRFGRASGAFLEEAYGSPERGADALRADGPGVLVSGAVARKWRNRGKFPGGKEVLMEA